MGCQDNLVRIEILERTIRELEETLDHRDVYVGTLVSKYNEFRREVGLATVDPELSAHAAREAIERLLDEYEEVRDTLPDPPSEEPPHVQKTLFSNTPVHRKAAPTRTRPKGEQAVRLGGGDSPNPLRPKRAWRP